MTFDSGEILTTFEPVQYELHDMKFLKTNLKETRNRTLLGSAMLSNEGDSTNDAGVFLGYGYDVVRNLGHAEGIARSINTTVFVSKEPVQSFFWGIQQNDHVEKTKGVSSILQPGTALNVTLWGNYTRKEGSYHANLVIHWSDGSKTKKKRILVHNVSYHTNNFQCPKLYRATVAIFQLNFFFLFSTGSRGRLRRPARNRI